MGLPHLSILLCIVSPILYSCAHHSYQQQPSSWLIDPSRLLRATISMLPLLIRTEKESLLHLHFLPYLILSLLACDSMKEGSTGLPDKRYLAYQNPSSPYRLFAFRCALTNSFLPYRRLLCILHYCLCRIPHPQDCALCSP